jgi:hypothetical protein
MNTKNVLIGGLSGGVAFFLLGWLIYGILLMDYMTSISPNIPGLNRSDSEFLLGILFISNVLSGLMVAYVFDLGKINGWLAGLKTGAILGFLVSAAIDSSLYSMTYMVSKQGMMVDVMASTLMWGVVGALIALAMGMGNKSAA